MTPEGHKPRTDPVLNSNLMDFTTDTLVPTHSSIHPSIHSLTVTAWLYALGLERMGHHQPSWSSQGMCSRKENPYVPWQVRRWHCVRCVWRKWLVSCIVRRYHPDMEEKWWSSAAAVEQRKDQGRGREWRDLRNELKKLRNVGTIPRISTWTEMGQGIAKEPGTDVFSYCAYGARNWANILTPLRPISYQWWDLRVQGNTLPECDQWIVWIGSCWLLFLTVVSCWLLIDSKNSYWVSTIYQALT